MKKELLFFLCVAAALLFGSCSDYSLDKEEQLDLPKDFDWRTYAEINKDAVVSQLVLSVSAKNREFRPAGTSQADSIASALSNCKNVLSNADLTKKIYLNYANCPAKGWFQNGKCTGIYANNSNYSKPVVSNGDTTWTCAIGACWRGGWNEISDKDAECTGDEELDWGKAWCDAVPKPLEGFIQDSVAQYTGATGSRPSFAPIRMMCQFVPKAESPEEAEAYLKSFYYLEDNSIEYGPNFDYTLVVQHYFYIGLGDGRPYKYCDGDIGEERNPGLADKRGSYDDYSKNSFCFNKSDEKVYVTK